MYVTLLARGRGAKKNKGISNACTDVEGRPDMGKLGQSRKPATPEIHSNKGNRRAVDRTAHRLDASLTRESCRPPAAERRKNPQSSVNTVAAENAMQKVERNMVS